MKSIQGKTALVTGAASGIGRAIAFELAAAGAHLCLLDIDEPRLREVSDELREQGAPSVMTLRCDLRDRNDLDAKLDFLLAETGGIDLLVNNAGCAYLGSTVGMSDRQWESLVALNLLAPSHIIRRLLPSMCERGAGHIVNIASVAGLVPFKRVSAYCLTKFGLVGFSESLRIEMAKYGVGVTTVCPGFVRTRLFESVMVSDGSRRARHPKDFLCAAPEAIALRVVKAIRRNQGVVVPGPVAQCLWLMMRMAPNLVMYGFGARRRPKARRLPKRAEQHAPQRLAA